MSDTKSDSVNTAESQANKDTNQSANRGGRTAMIGTVFSAALASSCCWGPPVILGLGLLFGFSTDKILRSMATSFETYRPLFGAVTFGFLGFAFYITYRPHRKPASEGDCSTPAADC